MDCTMYSREYCTCEVVRATQDKEEFLSDNALVSLITFFNIEVVSPPPCCLDCPHRSLTIRIVWLVRKNLALRM
jgi:hypothetical protein